MRQFGSITRRKAARDSEEEFRNIVRTLLARGVYPSPTEINRLRCKLGKQNTLGGNHTRWRREELEAAGWRRLDGTSKCRKVPRQCIENPRYAHPDWQIVKGRLVRREAACPAA